MFRTVAAVSPASSIRPLRLCSYSSSSPGRPPVTSWRSRLQSWRYRSHIRSWDSSSPGAWKGDFVRKVSRSSTSPMENILAPSGSRMSRASTVRTGWIRPSRRATRAVATIGATCPGKPSMRLVPCDVRRLNSSGQNRMCATSSFSSSLEKSRFSVCSSRRPVLSSSAHSSRRLELRGGRSSDSKRPIPSPASARQSRQYRISPRCCSSCRTPRGGRARSSAISPVIVFLHFTFRPLPSFETPVPDSGASNEFKELYALGVAWSEAVANRRKSFRIKELRWPAAIEDDREQICPDPAPERNCRTVDIGLRSKCRSQSEFPPGRADVTVSGRTARLPSRGRYEKATARRTQ